jgi:hypothetical protein
MQPALADGADRLGEEMMTRLAFATMLASLLVPLAAYAQSLDRFFFTPAERAELDVARAKKKQTPAPGPLSEAPAASSQQSQTLTYTGVVRRSDGRSMLWINGRLGDEQEALAGLDVHGRVRADGSMSLQSQHGETAIQVKVGQSVEVHTGSVAERSRREPRRARANDSKDERGLEDAKSNR